MLNPNLKGRNIAEAFKSDEYRILLVANKFQTGFDQPLLCGMYIDKRLAGIQAVQTLSRLNRAHPGKDTTYVLDFVNDTEEVLVAFKTYYTRATLSATTDPNLVFNLRAKLDSAGHYDDFEVNRIVDVALNPYTKQSELVAQYKIRLAGIDAPEKKQAFGNVSKKSLLDLVFDKQVSVDWKKQDQYGRTVGKVMLNGIDINLEQIKRGVAWFYNKYPNELLLDDRIAYLHAQKTAEKNKIGLWSELRPVAPWDFRKLRKSNAISN